MYCSSKFMYVVFQAMLDVTAEQGWLVSVDVLLYQLSHDIYMFVCCVAGYA